MKTLKKLMENPLTKACVIGVGVFIIILLIILLISACSGKRNYSYEELEEKIVKLAKDYYEKNEDKLPKNNGEVVSTSIQTFVNEGKLDNISDIVENNSVCTGEVNVYNNNGYYLYIPYLNCGKDYVTKTIYDTLVNDNNIVTSGNGLYEVGTEFVFKGDTVNNYVSLDNIIYRVLKVNDDGTIRVLDTTKRGTVPWDDRYNKDKDSKVGINEYVINDINSRIKDTLESDYKNDEYFNDIDRAFFVSKPICIGKRSVLDTINDGTLECLQTLDNQIFSLIQANEYYNASLDPNCSIDSPDSCLNYNYLKDVGSTWTITADKDTTHKVFRINRKGIKPSSADSYIGYRIVTTFNKDIIIKSGTGTVDDPYIIKTYEKK